MGSAPHLAADQPGALQRLDVLRGGRQRDREGLGQLAHRPIAASQLAQHPAARGVPEGVKDRIELRDLLFNHVVEYADARGESQPFG